MGKKLFDDVQSKIGDLLSDVKNGKVGLPDLQHWQVPRHNLRHGTDMLQR